MQPSIDQLMALISHSAKANSPVNMTDMFGCLMFDASSVLLMTVQV